MYAYVGCRTTKERGAHGRGLEVFRVDENRAWSHVQTVPDLANPSFLAFGKARDVLYTVHGDFSEVSAFRIDPATGRLSALNQQSTGGRNPVHLATDETGRFLVVANFATGTVALLPIEPDGSLGEICDRLELPGTPGPHRSEQKGSHPHQVLPDPQQRRFLIPDKGVDKVFVLRLDVEGRKLVLDDTLSVIARQGAAPRHGVFHPSAPYLYMANELDSTVTTYGYDAASERLTPKEIVSTLPPSCVVTSHAAGIQITPDGRFVYVSNRGHDSVAVFAIDKQACTLRQVDCVASGGTKPRFITLDPAGTTLFVANETSDTIVPFAVDRQTGALSASDPVVQTGSPVCIVFLDPSKKPVTQ
jgi:6-phosphogluconolactonase (cycloisomerase 2 family)